MNFKKMLEDSVKKEVKADYSVEDSFYTIQKKKSTKQYHIFKSTLNHTKKECYPDNKSICGIDIDECNMCHQTDPTCLTADKARKACAETNVGWRACGTCVSHLYKSILD